MADETLSYLWDTAIHRFLAEGINFRDLLDLRERITTIGEWPARWSEMAVQYEQRGDEALASGFTATAGAHLTRAALHYFFASTCYGMIPPPSGQRSRRPRAH